MTAKGQSETTRHRDGTAGGPSIAEMWLTAGNGCWLSTCEHDTRSSAMTTDANLRYDVSDRIAEISLARPPVNALSLSLLEQLIAAFRRAAADDNVRAVVLTSAVPRRFSAGLDLAMPKSPADVRG